MHNMTVSHDKNCHCVRCRPLESPCGCDACNQYKEDNKTLPSIFDLFYDIKTVGHLKHRMRKMEADLKHMKELMIKNNIK